MRPTWRTMMVVGAWVLAAGSGSAYGQWTWRVGSGGGSDGYGTYPPQLRARGHGGGGISANYGMGGWGMSLGNGTSAAVPFASGFYATPVYAYVIPPNAGIDSPLIGPASAPLTVRVATRADQSAINAQRVCPVSGQVLGTMGVPLMVAQGQRSILVCCPQCVAAVQAAPDRFLCAPAPTAAPRPRTGTTAPAAASVGRATGSGTPVR